MTDIETNARLDEKELRRSIVASLHCAGGGHFGGALSVIDVLAELYTCAVPRQSIAERTIETRDRVILSKGHAAVALYAVLKALGHLPDSDLSSYGCFAAGLEGHPDMRATPGVDFSSGSLGQGLAVGVGMAIALRGCLTHVWVVIGDGECQEGAVWEAALLAARYRLGNLHVIVDANGAQEFGWAHDSSLSQEPIAGLAGKWAAFGWAVESMDGHDRQAVAVGLSRMRCSEDAIPSVLVAKTRKGAGVALFERDPLRFHCTALTNEEFDTAIESLQ